MPTYIIYFTAFGRKLRKAIVAPTQDDAIKQLRAEITINKVIVEQPTNPFMDLFNGFLKP
jgi:hypothetical protein